MLEVTLVPPHSGSAPSRGRAPPKGSGSPAPPRPARPSPAAPPRVAAFPAPLRAEVRPGRGAGTAAGPRPAGTMAKWLNKYFSLGNNKTKSPPQPPRPDYREKRNGAGGAPRPDGPPELLRAYRAQKDRDFEDPYSGPGSSLRKLRALCRPEPCAPDEPGPAVRYISPRHRLIRVEIGDEKVSARPGPALRADDYSDPFDAKSELNKMVKGENTGYMEPYEAQRIMTDKFIVCFPFLLDSYSGPSGKINQWGKTRVLDAEILFSCRCSYFSLLK
uniref:Uncharacterized protein n=1 Tax=Pavo cristatus TaxID=9049 RepID=A0A8C9EV94_PAVCR